MAKIMVSVRRLRVMGVRLIPMLRATRSMLSSSSDSVLNGAFLGKRALMRLYPRRKSTKRDPRMYLA